MNSIRHSETATGPAQDRVLAEVWRGKDALSQSCGHEVSRMFAETRRRQAAGEPQRSLLARAPHDQLAEATNPDRDSVRLAE